MEFIVRREGGRYSLESTEADVAPDVCSPPDQPSLSRVIWATVEACCARRSPDVTFVHAASVRSARGVVLIVGASHSGKSTAALAAVRGGAVYFSDDMSPVDDRGEVVPFRNPISIRDDTLLGPGIYEPSALGSIDVPRPAKVDVVVFTEFKPGAVWRPQRLDPSEGLLRLVANVFSLDRTAVLRRLSTLAQRAEIFQSDRGDVESFANWLNA